VWTRLPTYVGADGVPAAPSRGGEKAAGRNSSLWHGKVEPLKWLTSAALPCKNRRDKTGHEHAVFTGSEFDTRAWCLAPIGRRRNHCAFDATEVCTYLDTRGADVDDLLGAVHLPAGAVEGVVQPARRLGRRQVHERVPHVAAALPVHEALKDFDQAQD
jgi:hypothetical protein